MYFAREFYQSFLKNSLFPWNLLRCNRSFVYSCVRWNELGGFKSTICGKIYGWWWALITLAVLSIRKMLYGLDKFAWLMFRKQNLSEYDWEKSTIDRKWCNKWCSTIYLLYRGHIRDSCPFFTLVFWPSWNDWNMASMVLIIITSTFKSQAFARQLTECSWCVKLGRQIFYNWSIVSHQPSIRRFQDLKFRRKEGVIK